MHAFSIFIFLGSFSMSVCPNLLHHLWLYQEVTHAMTYFRLKVTVEHFKTKRFSSFSEVLAVWVGMPCPRLRVVAEEQDKWLWKEFSPVCAIFLEPQKSPSSMWGNRFYSALSLWVQIWQALVTVNSARLPDLKDVVNVNARGHTDLAYAFLMAERDSYSLILCEIK